MSVPCERKPEEVSAVLVRVYRIQGPDLPGCAHVTFEAHVEDIHRRRPGLIFPASSMAGLAHLVARDLEERFDRARELDLAGVRRELAESEEKRIRAEEELARLRGKRDLAGNTKEDR